MKLRDYVTGRVVAWALIALLGAWFGIGRAQAQSCGSPGYVEAANAAGVQAIYATLDEASAACGSFAPLSYSLSNGYYTEFGFSGCIQSGTQYLKANLVPTGKRFRYTTCEESAEPSTTPVGPSGWRHMSECAVGEWREDLGRCFDPQECLSKPPLGETYVGQMASTVCDDGCSYEPGGDNISFNFGGAWTTVATGWKPSGEACLTGEAPPPQPMDGQKCEAAPNGQTACIKPDGEWCASASTGRQICWQPGETGEKTDGSQLQKTNAGNEPIPPASPQTDGGDTLEPEGSPMNTTINKNGQTINTTTQNYGTQNGTNAGTSNQGQPGDGSGDGEGDGEGEGGGAGPGVGDLYEGTGRTVGNAFSDFKTRVSASPLLSVGTNFLTVTTSSSCPVFVLDATYYWDSMTFDYHCQGELANALALGGWLILAIAAFAAFKIAFY